MTSARCLFSHVNRAAVVRDGDMALTMNQAAVDVGTQPTEKADEDDRSVPRSDRYLSGEFEKVSD